MEAQIIHDQHYQWLTQLTCFHSCLLDCNPTYSGPADEIAALIKHDDDEFVPICWTDTRNVLILYLNAPLNKHWFIFWLIAKGQKNILDVSLSHGWRKLKPLTTVPVYYSSLKQYILLLLIVLSVKRGQNCVIKSQKHDISHLFQQLFWN